MLISLLLNNLENVKLPEDIINQQASSEGTINVCCLYCECLSWALRNCVGMDLFDPALCDQRWCIEYYKRKQRIFKPTMIVLHH